MLFRNGQSEFLVVLEARTEHREEKQREPTSDVYLDLSTKDYGGCVEKADRLLHEKLELPPGYTYKWSGKYEFELRAKSRLKSVCQACQVRADNSATKIRSGFKA